MRLLLMITVLLAALWSGYWFVGQRAVQGGAEAFFATAPTRGLVAENAGLSVAGFPSRFDLTITEPRLGDPRAGVEWEAPFVQVLSLSYTPWHWIAALPNTQSLRLPDQTIVLASEKLQASLVAVPGTALALDRITVVGQALKATSDLGWQIGVAEGRFATRLDPTRTNTHEIGLQVTGLTPDAALAALLPDRPAVIDLVRLDALATFSAPIDRFAPQTRPELTALSIKEGRVTWGSLLVDASGDLAVQGGLPEGRIAIRITGWRALVPMAVAIGAVKPEVAPTVERMMEALATAGGNPDVLEMPLVFADGRMSLGPIPLGPAPRLN